MSIPADKRAARLRQMMADDEYLRMRLPGLVQLIEQVEPRSVLEIGCCRGHSTEVFLMYAERVVALDPWPSVEDDPEYAARESLRGDEFVEFEARCSPYRGLEIIRGRSPADVPQDHFDLIYIDGNHTIDAVKADIEATHELCTVLAGHDFSLSGVQVAVEEYCERVGKKPRIFPDTSWMVDAAV